MKEKYTYSDVIIDPNDPRLEVGKKYYFSLGAQDCVDRANRDSRATELLAIDKSGGYHPFISDGEKDYPFIIRKKGPTYAERQAKWIADNDVKRGDKVWIVREADSHEDGWDNFWTLGMDETVGKVGTVSDILSRSRGCGIEVDVPDVGPSFYPYFVLEKVEPRYVPFDLENEEDRKKIRGAWVRRKGKVPEYQVIAVRAAFVSIDGNMFNTKTMLECYEFLDGTPCGKLAEEERP